jgi:hypothetical protein
VATIPRIIAKSEVKPSAHRERYALLQRILWSHQFERSERLRNFLEYVTNRVLADPDAEVHEQEIGHGVFGRPQDYDTASDNIVRVTASQIRKKLEEYFCSEGVSEPVVLEIPRGRYTPLFRERTPSPQTVGVTSTAVAAAGRKETVVLRSALAVALAALVGCVGLLVRQHRAAQARPATPALTALWSSMFSPSRPTSVVVSDSSLSLYEELLGRSLSLADYITAHSEVEDRFIASNPALSKFARLTFGRGLTSRASTSTVYRIAELKNHDASGLLIVRPKDFSIETMKFANVVLLGSPRANPWVELIEKQLQFRYVYDEATHHSAFQEISTNAAEPINFPTDSKTSYCRIAFLPNLSGNGNILNIAGTETEGTEGGGEYVTNERTLEQLRERLGVKNGPFPYFEVLLKSDRVGGATPQLTIVAARLIHPQP